MVSPHEGKGRMFDLIVHNARIVDGKGGPPLEADLAVRDGRIASIGRELGAAPQAGVAWQFESFPEYLELLARRGIVPNVAAFMGHSGLTSLRHGRRRLAGVWGNEAQVHDGNDYLDHARPPGQVLTGFAA